MTGQSRPAKRARTSPWGLLLLAAPALAFVSWGALSGAYSGTARSQRRATEPSLNVRQLCQRASAHHARTGQWVAAGPLPRAVPKGLETVTLSGDEGFSALGWSPGVVRYQYAVEVAREGERVTSIRCTARGDYDGNGKPAMFWTQLDVATGEVGPVHAEDEEE